MHQLRKHKGSTIAETGPALFVLLILIFFPLVDFLYMGAAYSMAWFLHNEELRELSVRRPSQFVAALQNADDKFCMSSMANFLGVVPTAISHPNPTFTLDTNNVAQDVTLFTTVTVKPLLFIPFIPSVPGLSTSMPFTFSGSRPQEERRQ